MSTPNRYSRGKIYKICRDDGPEIYIGSTTVSTLAKRLGQHVSRAKAGTNQCASVQLLVQPGYYIILLEEYPCNSRDALRAREQHWIDTSECVVNKHRAYTGIAGLTPQEYKYTYHQTYKKELQQKKAQYYVENKESVKQRVAQYCEENKESIYQRRAEKIICECGSVYSRRNKAQHQKTQKHQRLMDARPTEL